MNDHFGFIIAGKHLIDLEVLPFDQSGYHRGILEFKYDMFIREENGDICLLYTSQTVPSGFLWQPGYSCWNV